MFDLDPSMRVSKAISGDVAAREILAEESGRVPVAGAIKVVGKQSRRLYGVLCCR